MVGVALTVLGGLLAVVALRDIFHTLFRPWGRGSLSGWVTRLVWRALHVPGSQRRNALAMAGPLALLAVIAVWAGLLVTGWALIYLPRLPDAFLLASGLESASQDGFLDALYLSAVTLSTLGYGAITPLREMRALAPLEALVGFALLSASISWVLSVTPAVARLHALGSAVGQLQEARRRADAEPTGPHWERLLEAMADRAVTARTDLIRLPTAYYFQDRRQDAALPRALATLSQLAEECRQEPAPGVRLAAARLGVALDRLAETVGPRFLGVPGSPRRAVFAAWAADHGVPAGALGDPPA